MTKFYEVKRRDGAARAGKLSVEENHVQTPLMLRVDTLSKKKRELEVFNVENQNLDDLSSEEAWNAPRGAVILPEVHPLFTEPPSAPLFVDFFVLSFASAMLNSPRDFARRIIDARNVIPPDSALWVPAIATAENAALMFYMGVDVIDDTNAVIKGCQGIYLMEDGEVRLNELDELPCNCRVCASLSVDALKQKNNKERASLLAKHNTLVLDKEVKKARACIRAGNLREYVEMRVRSSPFLTAMLRILDREEEAYFERRTPVARNRCMMANTMESLKRTEVKRFASRVLERYEPPARKILLILPCSARKPYSTSPSHTRFIDAIAGYRGQIHELILTSPLGVVPRELEAVYPAAFYDIPVTGYWDAEEREWVSLCLHAYLERKMKNYDVVVAHLSGAYSEICTSVAEDSGIEIAYTCEEDEGTTSKEALNRLKEQVAGLCDDKQRLSGFRMKMSMIKAMADFQFGLGAGRQLLGEEEGERPKINGKFPSYKLSSKGDVLARIVPAYGLLTLTVKGARRIENLLSSYTLQIGDFVPRGSILAPGVVNAGEQIRVNDEVVFCGEKAFGVGRAKMSGWEMVESRKGMAVQVRGVEEKV
uniref:Archaeosine synthase n=1 Tax=Candidatus Methanophagaceae archaeon ANME-1 ERB6 TaxID=2759912 RepID=A0A7G9YW03_9EURY|nr:archaeosine synthase [Methanosarcinales archaeon ANME-1 ERB6]